MNNAFIFLLAFNVDEIFCGNVACTLHHENWQCRFSFLSLTLFLFSRISINNRSMKERLSMEILKVKAVTEPSNVHLQNAKLIFLFSSFNEIVANTISFVRSHSFPRRFEFSIKIVDSSSLWLFHSCQSLFMQVCWMCQLSYESVDVHEFLKTPKLVRSSEQSSKQNTTQCNDSFCLQMSIKINEEHAATSNTLTTKKNMIDLIRKRKWDEKHA